MNLIRASFFSVVAASLLTDVPLVVSTAAIANTAGCEAQFTEASALRFFFRRPSAGRTVVRIMYDDGSQPDGYVEHFQSSGFVELQPGSYHGVATLYDGTTEVGHCSAEWTYRPTRPMAPVQLTSPCEIHFSGSGTNLRVDWSHSVPGLAEATLVDRSQNAEIIRNVGRNAAGWFSEFHRPDLRQLSATLTVRADSASEPLVQCASEFTAN